MQKPDPPELAHGGNGSSLPDAGMLDLDNLLGRISDRLIAWGAASGMGAKAEVAAERVQYMVFDLGKTSYGLELMRVGEVIRGPAVSPVPGLPRWVVGVTSLHGDIISVVDLGMFLEAEETASGAKAHDMIVAQSGEQRVGLMVDSVRYIYTFPVDGVFSPPFQIDEGLVPYLRGAVERQDDIIRLLDCERLLLGPEMQQFS